MATIQGISLDLGDFGPLVIWYDEYYYQDAVKDDPTGPAYGSLRVVRGGSWAMPVSDCRSAARRGQAPDAPTDTVGFRLVLTVAGTG